MAFATLGLLAISGGVLAYLFGTSPNHPFGGDTTYVAAGDRTSGGEPGVGPRPTVEALGDSTDPAKKPLTAPVIPVQPVDKDLPVVASSKPDGKQEGKPELKTGNKAGSGAETGTKLALAPTKEAGKPGKADTEAVKTEPGAPGKAAPSVKVASKSPPGHSAPAAEAGHKTAVALAPPPVSKPPVPVGQSRVVAANPPPGPGDSATTSPKPTGVPVIASKQQPKTWEVVALPEATPKPPQQRTVTIAGAPPSSTDSDSTPRSAHPPAPSQATADAASKPAAANDSESVLREAQSAFMHGDRQTAIAAAMRVTARGGEEAIKAWRFVGAAACTGKVAALAANAYRNLHDPDHKRLLVELCQRNGLHFHDGNFSTEE